MNIWLLFFWLHLSWFPSETERAARYADRVAHTAIVTYGRVPRCVWTSEIVDGKHELRCPLFGY